MLKYRNNKCLSLSGKNVFPTHICLNCDSHVGYDQRQLDGGLFRVFRLVRIDAPRSSRSVAASAPARCRPRAVDNMARLLPSARRHLQEMRRKTGGLRVRRALCARGRHANGTCRFGGGVLTVTKVAGRFAEKRARCWLCPAGCCGGRRRGKSATSGIVSGFSCSHEPSASFWSQFRCGTGRLRGSRGVPGPAEEKPPVHVDWRPITPVRRWGSGSADRGYRAAARVAIVAEAANADSPSPRRFL